MANKLTIQWLYELCRDVKQDISDDCRAFEDNDSPGIQLTVGADANLENWNYQTGDNSFTGGAYGYPIWGVVGVYRTSNCRELARDILNQIQDQIAEME